MSQEASTLSTLAHVSGSALAPAGPAPSSGGGAKSISFSADAYADRLMDELFEDVERSLELDSSLPETQVVEEPASELVFQPVAPLVVQPALNELEEEPEEEAEPPEPEIAPPLEVRQPSRGYDRLLLGFGCVAVAVALVVWLLLREVKQPAIVASPQATASPLSPADTQFAEYAKQALQSLSGRSQPDRKTASVPTPAPSTLPGVTVPKAPTTQATGGRGTPSVPPYQMPPTPVVPGMVAAPPQPLPSSPSAARSPEPSPSPTIARTLVGVMELGDRSAALVEIAGVVQRFRVGESISASGWTLVEVSKNQAVIRRNGEVRSIFIGQAF